VSDPDDLRYHGHPIEECEPEKYWECRKMVRIAALEAEFEARDKRIQKLHSEAAAKLDEIKAALARAGKKEVPL